MLLDNTRIAWRQLKTGFASLAAKEETARIFGLVLLNVAELAAREVGVLSSWLARNVKKR